MPHDRRQVLHAAMAALVLPLVSAPGLARAQGRAFAPPPGSMLYTRRLERSLPGNARFTVSRSFAIRFHQEAGGYRVTGEQVAVDVDAPDSLAPFAAMERERMEEGLFPLFLDQDGLIAAGADVAESPRLDQAVQEVLRRINALPVPEADQAEMTSFVRAVHANAAQLLTELPRDLFAPDGERSRHSRTVALPGGGEGVVTVGYTAETEPSTGLMRNAEREVVTEFAGSLRRTLERWTLTLQA
jgi:hypothetical protein